ncbi:MAG TPA: class I SAM-dependent methyltransferase [Phototrophicaceae bacterium]|nr:class I SAM-dependent methyltransferase [Phototrophicaceae bacterium]
MVEYPDVKQYIRQEYEGIFSEAMMERHYQYYVELELSQKQLVNLQVLSGLKSRDRLLDLGCGFGSFVLVCRQAGIAADGLDIAPYQINFARERLGTLVANCEPNQVYHLGDAQATGLPDASYDVITAWNLLEHVPNYRQVIAEAYRLLKPGGLFVGVAPNYLAFRREAHYQVPWLPLFPRPLARAYLRKLGRRTDFLDNSLYYLTNWGALRALKRRGFQLLHPQLLKFEHPELIVSARIKNGVQTLERWHLLPLVKLAFRLHLWNPLRHGIYFAARKPL